MKIVYCSLNISSLDPLIQLLEKEQIKDYQIIEPVKAKNIIGFPRLNSDVWPGYIMPCLSCNFLTISEQIILSNVSKNTIKRCIMKMNWFAFVRGH